MINPDFIDSIITIMFPNVVVAINVVVSHYATKGKRKGEGFGVRADQKSFKKHQSSGLETHRVGLMASTSKGVITPLRPIRVDLRPTTKLGPQQIPAISTGRRDNS